MKTKILLSLTAISLPTIACANTYETNETELIESIICQNETKCYLDIYDINYTFLRRVNIDFEENDLASKVSFTYDYFDNREVEGIYTVCLISDDKCKIFSNKETADLIFNNGHFSKREKRNLIIVKEVIKEIGKQGVRAFKSPEGKKVAAYMEFKYEALKAAIEINNNNEPFNGNPINSLKDHSNKGIKSISREIGGGGKITTGRPASTKNYAR